MQMHIYMHIYIADTLHMIKVKRILQGMCVRNGINVDNPAGWEANRNKENTF